jgi:FkbM family methyltransferase
MNPTIIKRRFWDFVRPLHSPITRAMRRRFGRNYFEHPEMELPQAYDAISLEAERRLHLYLHVARNDIKTIIIVGANEADEVPRLRHSYPSCRFVCFEPSPQWYANLIRQHGNTPYVTCSSLALSDEPGRATFYELPMCGNGSLLKPDAQRWSTQNRRSDSEVTAFEVQVSTLDREVAQIEQIDLLWIDVQGAEGKVLAGGKETLGRTRAVMLEVAMVESPYDGAMLFRELDSILAKADFTCVGLGIDGWNFTGNALWVSKIGDKALKEAGCDSKSPLR